MSGTIVWALCLFLSFIAMVYVLKIHPIVMTRPPVKKILELVARQDGFFVDNNVDEKQKKYKHVDYAVDFVLIDTINSTKSIFILNQFSGYVVVKGDFAWMNEFERKRLYKLLRKIYNRRIQKYNDACAVELDARYERDRQAAIKVYENR